MLMQHLNRRQLYEWMAYDKLFPFGDERDDFRSALQTFWGRVGPSDDPGEPKDYMPNFGNAGPKTEAQKLADEILESL